MSKQTKSRKASDSLKSRYDFTKGKRTDHADRYRRGHEVRIERADGSVTAQRFALEEGAILLEPDVRAVFRDSKTVNQALRCLIPLVRRRPSKLAG